ncbi:MAG TPA: class I SAM-dependent methyltransferase [Acidimicrobiia bacterium]|nr:class I SAM-dependent methyltransferase [Acidimicrobiia bacterium]
MARRSTRNILRNALRPSYARVMAGKVRQRVAGSERRRTDAIAWADARKTGPRRWCEAQDPELWAETLEFAAGLRERAADVGARVGVDIGFGARFELLYFLTRRLDPLVVVETGVAFGYSSTAFLTALARNGRGGRLWSSDFPYFRRDDPEALVGALVPDELRGQWTLRTAGDDANLPEIVAECGPIDLVHYDSDKTYAGRERGMRTIDAHLAPGGVVLMDDIQDNLFFRDYALARGVEPMVFGTREFFVGAVGL